MSSFELRRKQKRECEVGDGGQEELKREEEMEGVLHNY